MAQFQCGLWGWLAKMHSRRGSRACVARIDRRVAGEKQVCLPAPHDDMRRRRRESHGWRGLARSGRVVEPREGDDVDAILSRAEAALRGGDIDSALAELGALPAVAAEKLTDWRARAEARAAALAGAAELTDGEE